MKHIEHILDEFTERFDILPDINISQMGKILADDVLLKFFEVLRYDADAHITINYYYEQYINADADHTVSHIAYVGKNYILVFKISGFFGSNMKNNIIDHLKNTVIDSEKVTPQIHFMYSSERPTTYNKMANFIEQHIQNACKPFTKPKDPASMSIITSASNELGLRSYDLPKETGPTYAIDELYNDDFVPVHDNIIKSVEQGKHGITLLFGKPGTGKTSYIRRLIREHNTKTTRFVYMPPFLAAQIGTPEFLTFLTNRASDDSDRYIYIIEDAENILLSREGGENSAVSNILNASDGLLGDIIKPHFICTFNCKMADIDSAIKRPGRLIEQYGFKTLQADKAKALWKKVHGTREVPMSYDNLTLAEIFAHGSSVNPEVEQKRQSFGFVPS